MCPGRKRGSNGRWESERSNSRAINPPCSTSITVLIENGEGSDAYSCFCDPDKTFHTSLGAIGRRCRRRRVHEMTKCGCQSDAVVCTFPSAVRSTLHIPAGPIWGSLYVLFRSHPFFFVCQPVASNSEKHPFDVGWHAESDDVSGFPAFFLRPTSSFSSSRDRYRFLLKTCKLLLTGRKVG